MVAAEAYTGGILLRNLFLIFIKNANASAFGSPSLILRA